MTPPTRLVPSWISVCFQILRLKQNLFQEVFCDKPNAIMHAACFTVVDFVARHDMDLGKVRR